MRARFEVEAIGNNMYRVYDEYWDIVYTSFISNNQIPAPVAAVVRLVDAKIKNGDKHKWFAGGVSGHEHIFDIPAEVFPIPGRHKRYK